MGLPSGVLIKVRLGGKAVDAMIVGHDEVVQDLQVPINHGRRTTLLEIEFEELPTKPV